MRTYPCPTCATPAKWRAAGGDLEKYYCPKCCATFETVRGELHTPAAEVDALRAELTELREWRDTCEAEPGAQAGEGQCTTHNTRYYMQSKCPACKAEAERDALQARLNQAEALLIRVAVAHA